MHKVSEIDGVNRIHVIAKFGAAFGACPQLSGAVALSMQPITILLAVLFSLFAIASK
jgi:lipoprotein signal peptidase